MLGLFLPSLSGNFISFLMYPWRYLFYKSFKCPHTQRSTSGKMPTTETGWHAHVRGAVVMLGTKAALQGTPSSHTDMKDYMHRHKRGLNKIMNQILRRRKCCLTTFFYFSVNSPPLVNDSLIVYSFKWLVKS